MYIDIGGNKSLRSSEIVAVMDIETASTSKKTKEFLRIAGKTATEVSDELPRTFIIAKEKKNIKISNKKDCKVSPDNDKGQVVVKRGSK